MEDFVRETHERLAALEQANGALERRITDHHKLAQRLQPDSGVYNGRLEALTATQIRVEERLRSAEASQAAREVRLKVLEDTAIARVATLEAGRRAAKVVASVTGLLVAIVGLIIGLFVRK